MAAEPTSRSRARPWCPRWLAFEGQREETLGQGWELFETPPGAIEDPASLAQLAAEPLSAEVPGTVAAALLDASSIGEGEPHPLDGHDYWYRLRFAAPPPARRQGCSRLLCLDGLATVAEVWLNGTLLTRSESMFEGHCLEVGDLLGLDNELSIAFRALDPLLGQRRPRGRWPTRLVSNKNLRFFRTGLLGRMPGWSPVLPAVGPYRGIRWVEPAAPAIEDVLLVPTLDGSEGVLDVRLTLRVDDPEAISAAHLEVAGTRGELGLRRGPDGKLTVSGQLRVAGVEPWWPHTHGEPRRHPVGVELEGSDGVHRLRCGAVGFRAIAVDERTQGAFSLVINGQPIFCRGACWTPIDAARLHAPEADLRGALEQVRAAGMNMLRLSGTMGYEADLFYELCDELGILIWQDFAFANMDYPEDEPFIAHVLEEGRQLLCRLAPRACLAVLCGNSEVEQQAAMMGLPGDARDGALFAQILPRLCAERRPDVPFLSSTPTGGAMPFHVDAGVGHYYGVGAYLRPLDDARVAGVRFTPECLAFSNPPEDETLRGLLRGGEPPAHHPLYKTRVPRDNGAGWDFADVTDHYVERLFGVEARSLRYADPDRYLWLSRLAPAELMAATAGFWRPPESSCAGSLVWFLRDLWRGAGWGLIDSTGVPKAPYHYLTRAWAPQAAWFVDQGVNGLAVHVANDRPEPLCGGLHVRMWNAAGTEVESAEKRLELAPRGHHAENVDALIGHFVDATYAYRFGPPNHVAVCASFRPDGHEGPVPLALEAFHFPVGLPATPTADRGLSAEHAPGGGGAVAVTVRAERLAYAVHVEAKGYVADASYFHLAPGAERTIVARPLAGARAFRGKVRAANALSPVPIAGASR